MLKVVVLSISFLLLSAIAINGILPEIRDALEITQTQSELLVTIPSIATLIFVTLSNGLINRFGMKKVVIAGLIIAGCGGMMPVFYAESYRYLLAGRFLLGAGKGLIFTSSISYINLLFDEKERATLIGYRSAIEMLGQSLLTLGLGALAVISWNFSFIIHGIYFLVAIAVAIWIPVVESEATSEKVKNEEKMPVIIYPLALLIGIVVISSSMIGIRFPAMVTEIMGETYNSSVLVATKPILGIVAAVFFGKLHRLLGKKLFYMGMICLISAQLLVGFSNGSFTLLVLGFLLSSFVMGWIIPIVISIVSKVTVAGPKQRKAMSYILICANVGVFLMPFVAQGLEVVLGNPALTAPYPVMAGLVIVIFLFLVTFSNNKNFRKRVGLSYEKA